MHKVIFARVRIVSAICLDACVQLRSKVYIPIEGVAAGPDGKFVVSDENKAFDLLQAVDKDFLRDDSKQTLLLGGPAGSGKSTFIRELELFIETDYAEWRAKAGVEVVLIKVNLPTLRNPLSDLFREAAVRIGLREAQIHDLVDLVHAGKVELIFMLVRLHCAPSLRAALVSRTQLHFAVQLCAHCTAGRI